MKFLNHKLFFKIYLALIISFHLLMEFKDHEPFETIDYFDYPLVFIALLGVFGYAFGKKILFAKFWQIYLFLIILWDLYRNFYDFDYSSMRSSFELLLMLSLYVLIYTPVYIAIYLYGHENVLQVIKKRTKILLSILVIIVISNAITYKLSYDRSSEKNFLAQVNIDAMLLKAHDKNNTKIINILLPSTINSLFYMAYNEKNINKYSHVCREIDTELLDILDKFSIDNNHLYQGDSNMTKELKGIKERKQEGRLKIIEMCERQKAILSK